MDHSYSNAWQKLFVAVGSAMRADGGLQDRVYSAWLSGLHGIPRQTIPEPVWERLDPWLKQVTSEEALGSEGKALATTRKMSNATADELLTELVSIYDAVARAYGANAEE